MSFIHMKVWLIVNHSHRILSIIFNWTRTKYLKSSTSRICVYNLIVKNEIQREIKRLGFTTHHMRELEEWSIYGGSLDKYSNFILCLFYQN